jgi:glycosidase
MRVVLFVILSGVLSIYSMTNVNAKEHELLHVPSPDWREQIIYFVMIDRFNDGNSSNNNQGAGEYDPSQNSKYSGGDLLGLENKISYIKNLGATAVWITPPVAHQWWSASSNYGGYHGYWAENLMAVDKHFGSLEDYKSLSRALHAQNMYLVQDVVVNHMGNYFSYRNAWNKNNPAADYQREPATKQGAAPSQFPFSQNNAKDTHQQQANIYHWTPNIVDYMNPVQEHNYQMAGLDDLNTESPVVREALRQSYGYWIKEVGVDAFRVDTAFYVPADYFRDFLYSSDSKAPGIMFVAKQTGREQFYVFGEGFAVDKAYKDTQSQKINSYIKDAAGQSLMPGMLNFPLYGALSDVFARGHATAELSYRINSMMKTFEQPQLMASFIDNHDVDRYLVNGTSDGLKQSLLAMMTLPGIPVIYYGTEQGLQEQRASMFKTGFGSLGHDHFNEQSELYQTIKTLSELRKNNKVFTHGTPKLLKDNAAGAGVLAYQMQTDKDNAFIIFNSAEHQVLLDNLDSGLPEGTLLSPLYSIKPWDTAIVVGSNGRLSLSLPARSGLVLRAMGGTAVAPEAHSVPTIDMNKDRVFINDFIVTGTAAQPFLLVLDGDLSKAIVIQPGGNGRWQYTINTQSMMDATIAHRLVAWQANQPIASAAFDFRVEKKWRELLSVDDPKNDDHGPSGMYQYPDDAGWRDYRQQDIERISVSSAGNNLKITLKMHAITQLWNPANGFDHVAFSGFIEMPGKSSGNTVMPQQNSNLPNNMRWHYRWRSHGWSNAFFSADEASANTEGNISSPGALISVNKEQQSIEFIVPGKAIGNPASLSGIKLYLSTWDYDSNFRALKAKADTQSYGGGKPTDPKIMDDTIVITLP